MDEADAEEPRSHGGSGREGRGRPRTSSDRARERIERLRGDADDVAAYFKERVYATFTGLAIVLVLMGAEHQTAERSLVVLTLGVLGITAAGFASDVISHLAVHREFPGPRELGILGRIAGGALSTVVTPAILLALAWLEVFSVEAALRAASIVYLVTLAVIGWLAVRRSRLQWWEQLVALLILIALGFGVIGLQTLAHSVGER